MVVLLTKLGIRNLVAREVAKDSFTYLGIPRRRCFFGFVVFDDIAGLVCGRFFGESDWICCFCWWWCW